MIIAALLWVSHHPVLVSLSIVFVGVAHPQLAKFAIVLLLAIVFLFILAPQIREEPGVDRGL